MSSPEPSPPASGWRWFPEPRTYGWWNGKQFTTWAHQVDGGWSYT